uniref:Ovule protein n=1 Tax=Steinernema glaseri TaxID=37863 RepID=A0A1I7ZPS1_9BILA
MLFESSEKKPKVARKKELTRPYESHSSTVRVGTAKIAEVWAFCSKLEIYHIVNKQVFKYEKEIDDCRVRELYLPLSCLNHFQPLPSMSHACMLVPLYQCQCELHNVTHVRLNTKQMFLSHKFPRLAHLSFGEMNQ